MAAVTLRGDAARILNDLARERWFVPPPEEVVTVAERTPREYLAFRRLWWIVWSLLGASLLASLGMLVLTFDATRREAELAAVWFGLFGGALLLSMLAWLGYRSGQEATLGPLDAPARIIRAEPDALVIESPGGAPRRLAYANVQTCVVEGHRGKHLWILDSLTLDDGAGPVQLRRVWLRRERVLVALADRLLRSGAVVCDIA